MPANLAPTKPQRRTEGLAPYEPDVNKNHRLPPVTLTHGGYGVLMEGNYVNGPFYLYENAVRQSARFARSKVVRWSDFVRVPAKFAEKLKSMTEPAVVACNKFGEPRTAYLFD